MGKRHIVTIDIVRFIAALFVMFFHLAYKAFAIPTDALHHLLPPSVTYGGTIIGAFGWIGVQVFFVVSGFVIAYSVEGETLLAYCRRRFLRLAPAVWIIVPPCAVIAVFVFHDPLEDVVFDGLKTAVFSPFGPWIIGQFWTLPIEIVFYTSVAVLILFKQVDRLELFGILLGLFSAAYWFADALFHFPSYGQQIMRLCLLQHGIFFAIGIVIHRAGIEGLTPLRLAFLGLMTVAAFFQMSWSAQWEAGALDPALRACVPFMIWFVLTGLVCTSVLRKPRQGAADKPHFATAARALGLATYPLYLLHFHVGGLVLVSTMKLGLSVNLSIFSALVASVFASLLVAQFVEPRLRASMRQWHIFRKASFS